ncbi:MAG: S8 family serine peptidase [Ramlibacter sp.]|nr:S8 family serine peptidase [Ramlibacter sp.]
MWNPIGTAILVRLCLFTGVLALTACGGGQSEGGEVRTQQPIVRQTNVEIDKRAAWPNDVSYSLSEPLRTFSANIMDAWQFSTGDPNLVIAVIDSGVVPHAEFSGRLLPGYDFISNVAVSRDGDGRDADATDPGNGAGPQDAWPGTFIAGVIAATGNNGVGIAGVNWKSKILPVRVLPGSSQQQLTDLADAIKWSAGGSVPGVPDNKNPARVINLGSVVNGKLCDGAVAEAVRTAIDRKAVVVVAAGDWGIDIANALPANCPDVIVVGNGGEINSLNPPFYPSNYGTNLGLIAPYYATSFGIDGSFGRITLTTRFGTANAAAYVSGVASLMLSVNPSLTQAMVKSLLMASARKPRRPEGSYCTPARCGAGMLDGYAAVKSAKDGQFVAEPEYPQTGWWWNPSEPGSGFAMEFRHGKIYFGGFLYDSSGKATWLTSGPALMESPNAYTGILDRYVNGQTLMGPYRSPFRGDSPGTVHIEFSSPTKGRITWSGRTFPIERFEIFPGGLAQASEPNFQRVSSGWYWDPAQPGRGYALEVQGDKLFAAGFMYDEYGDPVWYVTTATLTAGSNVAFGHWAQYADGQTMNGAYRTPRIANPSVGTALLIQGIDYAALRFSETMPYLSLQKFDMGERPAP